MLVSVLKGQQVKWNFHPQQQQQQQQQLLFQAHKFTVADLKKRDRKLRGGAYVV